MPNQTLLSNLDLVPVVDASNVKVAATLRFFEDESNGSNFVSLRAPSTLASSISYVLPSAQGAASTFLQNDGNGGLTWAAAGGGGGGVLYDVSTSQTTAVLGNKLFDVSYTNTGTGGAPGAFITATSKGNGNTATGLTLSVDSASTNSTIQGIVIDATSGAAATTATGISLTATTSGAASAFGLVTQAFSSGSGQLSQALTIGPATTQAQSGYVRYNSYLATTSQTPPDGYQVYEVTDQGASPITIPGFDVVGKSVFVLNTSGGLITLAAATMQAGAGLNTPTGTGRHLISNGVGWVPVG